MIENKKDAAVLSMRCCACALYASRLEIKDRSKIAQSLDMISSSMHEFCWP